ncbi:MAG: TetR/AcrR family transcriptional regulator [Pirellulaceae bacterium]
MSKRSETAIQTRERLFDEALTLFSQKGYAATSIRDILDAAKVTQPTLYYHFAGKADLFQALIERYYDESHTWMSQVMAAESTVEGKLLAFAVSSFEYCGTDPRIPRLMFQTYFGPTVPEIDGILDKLTERRFRIVVDIMDEGIRQGILQAASADLLALTFCSLVDQPINLFSRKAHPKRYLTVELANAIIAIFLNGASTRSEFNAAE